MNSAATDAQEDCRSSASTVTTSGRSLSSTFWTPATSCSSTLKAMADTSHVLAVQQSMIGNRQPSSLGKKQWQANGNAEATQRAPHNSSQSADLFLERYFNKLVQYPPDIISTTVEHRSEASSTLWGASSVDGYPVAINSQEGRSMKTRGSRRERKTTRTSESNDFDGESVISDNCSDVYSTVSGFSALGSGLLKPTVYSESVGVQCQEVTTSSTGIQVNTSTDSGILFDIKRENANLKGQLESMSYVVEEMVKERSGLQTKIYSHEKELLLKANEYKEMVALKERLLNESEDLKNEVWKWESITVEYQEIIEAKTNEVKAVKEDQKQIEDYNEQLKITIEQLKVDVEQREGKISEQKTKEMKQCLEIESLLRKNVHLEEQTKALKSEIQRMADQREWFETEMKKLQNRIKDAQQKIINEQSDALSSRTASERMLTENLSMKQRLYELSHKTVKEKEMLMKHLEGIGADLMEQQADGKMNAESLVSNIVSENVGFSQKERVFLKKQVDDLKLVNSQLSAEKESLINGLKATQKQLKDKEHEVVRFKSTSSELETKIRGLNVDLKSQKDINDIMRKEKVSCEAKVASVVQQNKTLELSNRLAKECLEKHERTLKQLKSDLVAKENKLELNHKESDRLEGLLTQKEDQLKHLSEANSGASVGTSSDFHLNFAKIQNEKEDLEKVINALKAEIRAMYFKHEQEKQSLVEDNKRLSSMLESESRNCEEVKTRHELLSEENSSLQQKLDIAVTERDALKDANACNGRSNSQVESARDEKIRCLESNLKVILRKYKEAMRVNEECSLQAASQLTENSLKDVISVGTETDNITSEAEQQVQELTREVERLRELLDEKQSALDENEKIILKLEHEKGQLVNAEESMFKQQLTSLEAIITSKNNDVSSLTSKFRETEDNHKDEMIKLNKRISLLNEEVKKEKALVKDLRHTVFMEKRDSSHMKRDMNILKKALSEANLTADRRRQELLNIEATLDTRVVAEAQLRGELEQMGIELTRAKEDYARLQKNMTLSENKEGPLLDQLHNLSLSLKEKNQENEGLSLKTMEIQRKHEAEMKQLIFRMENVLSEIEILKAELIEVRKEKFTYQSKVGELRTALKSSVEQNNRLKAQLESCEIVAQECPFSEEFINKLLTQSYVSTTDKKPLVGLQLCVESLKQEMETLQKQLKEQSN